MLKIERFVTPSPEQWNIVLSGMRNPMNSWERMDSEVFRFIEYNSASGTFLSMGPNDRKLARTLAEGGSVHAKYRRMLPVWVDILAPLYWWKEFDTYKVGTVANSCSTMHKIHEKNFTLDDFSCEHLISRPPDDIDDPFLGSAMWEMENVIGYINEMRTKFLATNDKHYWWQMIQLLPSSYNQKRTVMLNYQVLHDIYRDRRDHKLDEWHVFCDWIRELSYSELITLEPEED